MDNASFIDKVSRFAKLSSSVGGFAARAIGEKTFGIEIDDEAYAKKLKQDLGLLKGPLVKVAQFLATIPDAIPSEYANHLLELQSNAPSMGPSFVRRRMQGELGPDWQSKFQSFNMEASAAASLGQVHQAQHHDGSTLACKLQYPHMIDTVESDLNNFKLILGLYHTFSKAINTQEIQQEIKDRLLEELDYSNELYNIEKYQKIFQDLHFVDVPQVFSELSTKRLLTMQWMEGTPLLQNLEESCSFREQVATNLFSAWYLPFYHHGVIHGDPHLGNYLVKKNTSISLLDFGCVRHFSANFVKAVVDLYKAFRDNKPDLAVHAYEQWGFTNISNEIIEIMNQWALLLYSPLLEDKVRPIQQNFSGAHGWETASKVHSELKRLGGIRPPREFVFMDRAAVGLGASLMRLRVELNWHKMFENLINNSSFL